MPFGFIVKLAEKLLGKTSAKKPAAGAKKTQAQPKKQRRAGGRATAKPNESKRDKKSSVGKTARPNRENGDSRDKKAQRVVSTGAVTVKQSAPRHGENRKGASRRAAPEKSYPNVMVASSGRPISRPQSHEGRRRGAKVENTAPNAQRPGGAVSDEEQAKLREQHANWSVEQFKVEPVEGKKRFHDFDLPSELMHAIADLGFSYCTPIQALSLEHALAGKNVAGRAQTGTGKTAAFLVAILTRYLRTPEQRPNCGGTPRTLVLAPTRELVIQICKDAEALGKYCNLRTLAIYGGMDHERQRQEVSGSPVDLLVATPGRLLDFVRSRVVDLSHVDTLVIDEADRMLDMGFIPDVRSIVNRLPPKDKRCTMLYSATLSEDVMRLASQWMEEPVRAEVECEQLTTKTVKQIVYVVTAREKFTVLYNHIQQFPDSRILIFCNRKHTTEEVNNSLCRRGIRCEMLSGDVNQNRRLRVLEDFRSGKVRIVVATDVAGRGLHVEDIGFVINFDFPYEPEDYVHRIGRTGRAGASGTAISFADEDESFIIPDIEKYIGEELKCTILQGDDPLLTPLPPPPPRGGRSRSGRSNRGHQDAASPEAEAPAETTVNAEDSEPVVSDNAISEDSEPAEAEVPVPVAEADQPVAVAEDAAVVPETTAEPVQSEEPPVVESPPAAETAKPVAEPTPPRRRTPFIRPRNELFVPVHGKPFIPGECDGDGKSEPQSGRQRFVAPPPHHHGPVAKLHGKFSEEWTPGQNR